MDDQNNTTNNIIIDDQELDYLYSLYKSSQSGTGVVMTKEELRKLNKSERLTKKADSDLNETNIKKGILFNFPKMPDIKYISDVQLVIQNMLHSLKQ